MIHLDDLKPFIDWLHLHPGLAGCVVLLISCAESLAIIGLFIPGSIVMPAIGSMIGTGVLPGPLILLAAIIGAIIGDGLSYWLGYYYHQHIRSYWPFKRFSRLLKSGEQFFVKYGGLSVFIGRFVGPVRPIIPVVAGMMSMKPNRFLVVNILSAIAWAIAYMAPGFLLGAISEQLAPHAAARLLVILALFTLGVWLLWWALKRLWRYVEIKTQNISHTLWQHLAQPTHRWHVLHRRLVFSKNPLSHKPLLLLLITIVCIVAFLLLIFATVVSCWLTKFDASIYYLLRSCEFPGVDHGMAVLQAFSTLNTYGVVLTLVSCWLVWRHRWRALFCWLANFMSCWLLIVLVKALLQVARPAMEQMFFVSWSFPSLHGGLMASLYMGLILLVLPHIQRRIWSKVVLLGVLLLVSAIPQLYFGLNWFSDELGGLLIAVVVGALWIIFYYRSNSKARFNPKPLLWLLGLSFVLAGTINAKMNSEQFLMSLKIQAIKLPVAMQAWWQGKPLPIHLERENVLGELSEMMTIQYVGSLAVFEKTLEAKGWQLTPEPSLMIILNRIAAKDRLSQLPLIPDLYQARKPAAIMTKVLANPARMLVLRLWATTVIMEPQQQPLWLGTVQYRQPWHFNAKVKSQDGIRALYPDAMTVLASDLMNLWVVKRDFSAPLCLLGADGSMGVQPVLLVRSVAL